MKPIANFTFRELISTSVPDVDNIPTSFAVVENILRSAEKLQEIRNLFGYPVKVNSGYRSDSVNVAVGGVPNSWHRHGLAFDITSLPCYRDELKQVVSNYVLEHPEIVEEYIEYPTFIHIAFKF